MSTQYQHYFQLSVQRAGSHAWGELQKFEYVPGDQFLTRKAALRHAETARMRWQSNYAQFRDAKFRIMDSADMPKKSITRKAYNRLQEAGVAKVDNSKASIAPGYVAQRRQYDGERSFRTNAHKVADEHAAEMFSILAPFGRL